MFRSVHPDSFQQLRILQLKNPVDKKMGKERNFLFVSFFRRIGCSSFCCSWLWFQRLMVIFYFPKMRRQRLDLSRRYKAKQRTTTKHDGKKRLGNRKFNFATVTIHKISKNFLEKFFWFKECFALFSLVGRTLNIFVLK